MASGGARARSGPPPDPNALRRNRPSDKAGWVTLDPEPREGDTPDWPLFRPTKRELVLWAREWLRPQAVMWERNGQQEEVALYVRSLAAAERTSATVAARTLVRQQQDALGISLPGLLRNRWKIGEVRAEVDAAKRDQAVARAKDRGLTVVRGGNADAA